MEMKHSCQSGVRTVYATTDLLKSVVLGRNYCCIVSVRCIPLKKREKLVERRVVSLSLAGLRPLSILSVVIDPNDGSMASLPSLRKLSHEYCIPIVSITDLIRYMRKREKLVERRAVSRLPTKWGRDRRWSRSASESSFRVFGR